MQLSPAIRRQIAGLPPHKQAAVIARTKWMDEARNNQLPPYDEDWFVFLILAGRGYGKSRVASEEAWFNAVWNDNSRVAVVAPTTGDLRRTCFEGQSGILNCVPEACLLGGDRDAAYNRSLFELRFANGSIIQGYSAAEPDRLRGANTSFAICDELATWPDPQYAYDMLTMTLRLGEKPRAIIATTPRPLPILRDFIRRAGHDVRLVRGSTLENANNLPASFLHQLKERYAGTRLGRQELDAELLDDVPGALWPRTLLESCRLAELPPNLPHPEHPTYGTAVANALNLLRIVVGVDPSGARDDSEKPDEIGIVVAGVDHGNRAYVLEDASGHYSPERWGRMAVRMFDRWGADRIVAEGNFGGGMVEANIRAVRRNVPVTLTRASRGKAVRAEPVAALYEQHRVFHLPRLEKLEDQLGGFTRTGYHGDGSPDRADALVWCLSELMLSSKYGYSIYDLTGTPPPEDY